MYYSIKGFKFDVTNVLIFIAPLLATLVLTCVMALQDAPFPKDSSFDNQRFIVMPMNCYLKSP